MQMTLFLCAIIYYECLTLQCPNFFFFFFGGGVGVGDIVQDRLLSSTAS